jgi:hypothetical protein
MGMWEHMKLGEFPRHNTLGFFCWGRSLKIHIEIKRELFAYIEGNIPSIYTRIFYWVFYTFLRNQGQLVGGAH